jgi:2-keto-4-pentenoate hydratase
LLKVNPLTGGPLHPIAISEEKIAARFVAARAAGVSLPGFPGSIPLTLADAYRVQDLAIAQIVGDIGGWKVGRIFPPLSEQYGSDRLAGPIFRKSICLAAPESTPAGQVFSGGFGAVEAEFLFRIGTAPTPGQTRFSLEEAASLVDRVHVGIEIASSPLATINDLGPPVIISDFGNNNGLIIGSEVSDWHTFRFADWNVVTLIDGVEAGRGSAAAFPDGPIGSVRFLLELMAQRGISLPPETWVSTGAVSGVHDVVAGQRVETHFGPELKVTCTVAAVPRLGIADKNSVDHRSAKEVY